MNETSTAPLKTPKLDPETARAERRSRLNKRVNELKRMGYYSKDDFELMKEMVNNGICLIQLEWMVVDAYEHARSMAA